MDGTGGGARSLRTHGVGLLLGLLTACGGGAAAPDATALAELPDGAASAPSPQTGAGEDASASLAEVLPSDPRIRYTGRWDHSAPEAPVAAWQGSSVTVRFEGTGVEVTLSGGSRAEVFMVVVDGDAQSARRFEAGAGRGSYTLVSGLPSGPHTVHLARETHEGSASTFHGLSVQGGSLSEPPAAATRRMEFYGDSNLAGHSLRHEEDSAGAQFVGSYFGYAGITARMFDADYHNISVSGATISGLEGFHDQLDRTDPSIPWDMADHEPDLVVLNIGANDVSFGADRTTMEARYHALLDTMRAARPDAHIMLYNGRGWGYEETAGYIDAVVASRGDGNMSSATFPWLFEQWHGCEYDHGGMAAVLAAHLSATLGWQAKAADVMSGFGQDGDVANGGFEQVAPFGGFGWRYMLREGVSRVHDPGAAHEGAHFLRLENAAEAHQPNPAVDGEVVTVSAWLRGQAGSEARVTVDFRDQEMWTDPLQTETRAVTLGDSWQEFTVTATAPVGGANPVFHTRLTFTAPASGVLEVDQVAMVTEAP